MITRSDTSEAKRTTRALQDAIDRAADSGGGRVSVAPGVHETGALRLRSRVELHLEAGAVLRFVADPALYPPVGARWEGASTTIHSPCVYARGENDIAITGRGEIDGGGAWWWSRFRDGALAYPRPTLLGLHECTRVEITGVTLRNSPAWTVHPLLCDDVRISGIRILNPPASPNTDGIDPESCRNVRISDCHIDVGDDCIAIKAGSERSPQRVACENIAITNCTMIHGHGAVVIGSEMSGGVRGVVISNCVFAGTDRGIRIKTRRGRGGTVSDVRGSNIVMDEVSCPLVINPFYFCGPDGKLPAVSDRAAYPVDAGTPRISGIHLSHVTATNVHACAAWVSGLPEAPLEEITLDDVAVSFAPDPTAAVPAMADGVPMMAGAGIHARFTTGLRLTDVRVTGASGPALVIDDTARLQQHEGVSG
ncbi:glycoside hydrolase family 28 protein [Microbacterium protaetiae]|uniref:Glycoside hydrolase family 28 protein n=1 Tax=Microbacterium protaetiae TaxID=2509458 RepID=A0A4P6EBV1_9MICO|nr:glycoside hydrolase family 28 protein [Microbacterium protaetiae]QAY59076.1 glycoside hydrolase family 28 protein [Microbacterium protaetiae]